LAIVVVVVVRPEERDYYYMYAILRFLEAQQAKLSH